MVVPWRSDHVPDSLAYDPESDPDRSFEAVGIEKPELLPAGAVAILDEEPVIGVVVRGHSRAYLREALSRGAAFHIVNDVLADLPVSVTYCDLDDCVRGFAGRAGEPPLLLAQGGRQGGQMILKIGKRIYGQRTEEPLAADVPPFPYMRYPTEKTTWGVWRSQHPDTDIYLGDIPPKGIGNRQPPTHKPFPLTPFIAVVMTPLVLAILLWIMIVWPRSISLRSIGRSVRH